MNKNDDKEYRLSTAQDLADKDKFEEALELLGTMECTMSSWLRGQIYLAAAEKLSKSVSFIYCGTGEMKEQYKNLLLQAQIHLHKTAAQLPAADREIQDHLNKCLWNRISKVEQKICETRPIIEVKESDNIWEEDNSFPSHRTDDLIDELSEWKV